MECKQATCSGAYWPALAQQWAIALKEQLQASVPLVEAAERGGAGHERPIAKLFATRRLWKVERRWLCPRPRHNNLLEHCVMVDWCKERARQGQTGRAPQLLDSQGALLSGAQGAAPTTGL